MISWNAKKQKTVAASSCEAEYIAAFEAAHEGIWLHTLLAGIHISMPAPTIILCDNNSAINLSEDPLLHARVKHIDIKYHFLRACVHSKDLTIAYRYNTSNVSVVSLVLTNLTRLPCEEECSR